MHRRTQLNRALLPLGVALAILVSGCGATTNAGTGSSQASMHCAATTAGHGVDNMSVNVTCTLSGAPSSDTSFTLTYALAHSDGSAFAYGVTCDGTLHNGQGQCSQTVNVIAPAGPEDIRVKATLAPSKHTIGPMAPVVATS